MHAFLTGKFITEILHNIIYKEKEKTHSTHIHHKPVLNQLMVEHEHEHDNQTHLNALSTHFAHKSYKNHMSGQTEAKHT